MSTAPGAVSAPGEEAVAARIHQIEGMLEELRAGRGAAAPAAAPAASFASQLASATGAHAASVSFAAGQESGAGGEYEAMIQSAAQRNGIEPAILHGLIQQESGFDPGSHSSAGAMGLTQLMPETASSLGVSNPYDPAESIEGGARYLAGLLSRFGGNVTDALAAYNAGPAAVSSHGGVPPYPETESYVSKVLGYAEAFRREHGAASTTGTLL
jgi:soluble lytic murein transglycosylase-like protein